MVNAKFSTGQAQILAGLSHRQMNYWSNNGFTPSIQIALGRGERRKWSFRDIVALKISSDLRDAGIPLQTLRPVAAFIGKYGQPFTNEYLVVRGNNVTTVKREELLSIFNHPGQVPAITVIDVMAVERSLKENLAAMAA